jgi:YidC/Oxa1 family membrane protein insertase
MFETFFDALGAVLNFFYSAVPTALEESIGFGIAIMGLTVLVMVLITPLTVKSTRSMLQMQRLQPEMKRIQEKYKNDRERMNQELMAFYQEHKINPLGGCLPIVAQMPVFIVMYQLLRGLTTRPGGLGTGVGHIAGQTGLGDPLTPWVYTDQFFQPQHLNPDTTMYKALAGTNDMNFLGMDLALTPSQALKTGLLIAVPYFLLLAIMLVTGIVQNRQLQARNTSGNVNPQQQAIMKFMPFFLPVFSFGFPAGLALYWCTQNLCRIGTNHYITKSVYSKEHEARASSGSNRPETSDATSTKSTASAKKKAGDPGRGSSPGDNGAGRSGSKGSGAKKTARKAESGSKGSAAEKAKPDDKGPGKSVRSQKAHEKATGQRTSGSTTSSSGRRSGERRGGPRAGKGD